VHFFIRVIRRRVFDHRDLVAKFSGITNRCLHTRMGYEPDDDELLDAVLLELQIQIRVGETTGAPMLMGDDLACPRCEFAANLPAPGAAFERLVRPSCFLDGRNVFPGLVVALAVPVMQCIDNAKTRITTEVFLRRERDRNDPLLDSGNASRWKAGYPTS
jgi:hypothetical protein